MSTVEHASHEYSPPLRGAFFYVKALCVPIVAVAAYFTMVQIVAHVPPELSGSGLALAIVVAFFLGMVTADFLSGVAHFAFDNFGDGKTPFFGPHFIQLFRDHHHKPQEITLRRFFDTNGTNAFSVLPLMVLLYWWVAGQLVTAEMDVFVPLYLWFLLVGLSLTNQFHKWAHSPKRSALVQFLQGIHLILPFNHHTMHHRGNHDQYYCITTGWLNPILTKSGFWEAILKLFKRPQVHSHH